MEEEEDGRGRRGRMCFSFVFQILDSMIFGGKEEDVRASGRRRMWGEGSEDAMMMQEGECKDEDKDEDEWRKRGRGQR